MKSWLIYAVSLLFGTHCATCETVCSAPTIDFGEVINGQKFEYVENDRVQFKCHLGYELEGSDWIECKEKKWVPPLRCLAPCIVTKLQLDARNLLLSDGKRHSKLVKNGEQARFVCRKGYIIIVTSVMKCRNGKMNLPSCIPSAGGT